MTTMKQGTAVKTVSRAAVQQLNDQVARIAQGIIGRGETYHPMIALASVTADGSLAVRKMIGGLAPFFCNEEGKDLAARRMRELLALPFVEALVFVIEAWALIRDKDQALDLEAVAQSGGVAAQPDRVECIIINIATKSEQYMSLNKIIRGVGTMPRLELGELSGDDGDNLPGDYVEQSGRFALLSE